MQDGSSAYTLGLRSHMAQCLQDMPSPPLPSPPTVVSAEQLVVRTRAFSFPRVLAFQFDITDQALRDSQVLDEVSNMSVLQRPFTAHLRAPCIQAHFHCPAASLVRGAAEQWYLRGFSLMEHHQLNPVKEFLIT